MGITFCGGIFFTLINGLIYTNGNRLVFDKEIALSNEMGLIVCRGSCPNKLEYALLLYVIFRHFATNKKEPY
jgi:hypothetical protein